MAGPAVRFQRVQMMEVRISKCKVAFVLFSDSFCLSLGGVFDSLVL